MKADDQNYDTFVPCPVTNRGEPSFIEASETSILYFNGPTVILRSLNQKKTLFINHLAKVTAAKFSNDYKFVASIDQKGTLMLHEIGPEKVFEVKKSQNFYLGAKSIDFTADNKKICVVGSGKGRYGRIVSIDTFIDTGEISAVTANLTAVSFRPERPYKLCVAGDQFTMKYFDGPPYKFVSSKKSHSNFVNQIKYNYDGTIIASVSSDRKIVLYDGKTGQIIKQLNQAHQAGIMGIAWINNENLVTVSSDKTIKFWNIALQLQKQVPINQQQQKMKLLDAFIVAVSYCRKTQKLYCLTLSGQIRQFSKQGMYIRSLEGWRHTPKKILLGKNNNCFVIDANGKIIEISESGQVKRRIKNTLCFNKVFTDASINDNYLFILTVESNVIIIDLQTDHIIQTKVKNANFITFLDEKSSGFLIYGKTNIHSYKKQSQHNYKQAFNCELKSEPTQVHRINKTNAIVIGNMKGLIQVFQLKNEDTQIQFGCQFQSNQNRIVYITNHNELLFVGDSTGALKALKFDVLNQDGKVQIERVGEMSSHTASVTGVLVNENLIYTFSMDNSYSIWNLSKFMRKQTKQDIHKLGIFSAVMLNSNRFVTSGGDFLVKVHDL